MTSKDRILEAHVQHELKRFRGDHLKGALHEEIAALFDWLEQVKVNDVVRSAQILSWVKRNVIEMPISDEVTEYIKESVTVVYEFLSKDETRVAELLPRQLFDEIVAAVTGMGDLRREVTHQIVSSSVYSMLISNVLYHGIKDFVLTENVLAKNIPGVSSLVRFSQGALNSAAPKLEKGIDKQLIKFINDNVQETVRESEEFLDTVLDETLIRKVGDEVWNAYSEHEMSRLVGYVDADSLAAVTEVIQDFWLHYRETLLFWEIVKKLLHGFFQRYGEKDIRSVLHELGITQEMVTKEAYAFALPVVEKALATGYLEERIRQRLDAFYTEYYGHDAPSAER